MQAIYISSSQFEVSTDKTSEFLAGRRVRANCGGNYKYSTIQSSIYSDPNTTITIEESILTSNLIEVHYGIVNIGDQGSFPDHTHDGTEGTGGSLLFSDMIDYAISPMIVTGGEITEGTTVSGTFKVAALTALLRETDSAVGELIYITKTEEDNITIPLVDTLYYVVLNYNSGSPTISLITDLQAFTDSIPLGSIMKNNSNDVHYISGCYRLQNGVAKLHYRAFELYNLYLTEGNTIAYSGTNNFTMTAGVIYEGINRLTQVAYDSAVTTFIPVYQNGSGGWIEDTFSNVIDFAHYDDGDGTLGNVGVSKYGCHWVYRHVDNDAAVYVLYGRDSYSLAEAEVSEVPSSPDHLTNFGCLIGRIIAPKAGGSFASIQMVTDTVFTGQSVATHNDLGGLNANDYKHLTAVEYGAMVFDDDSRLSDARIPTAHIHDDRYYTESEVNTISGSLSSEIDSDISTHTSNSDVHHSESHNVASHSDTTATGANLNTLIGGGDISLHKHDGQYYTEGEVDTISGSLQLQIDGTTTFLELTDTPSSYDNGKYLRSTVDGTEWVTTSGDGSAGAQSFLDLDDTPVTYSGVVGKYLKTTNSGIEFSSNTWINLEDTPESYPTLSGSGFPLDYSKRIKLTIDNTKVDTTLSSFPVLIKISNSSGTSSVDATPVFTEIGSDANRKKIAVTTSNETTQCYVEIERWDHVNQKAWLWIKVPSISSSTETVLYLHYDSTQDDNTTYVGDTGDTPAQLVWGSSFRAVYHMAQDPNGDVADTIKDSTVNANHGTPTGSMTSADLVDGKIGKAIDFDGNDSITLGTDSTLDIGANDFTLEAIGMWTSGGNIAGFINIGSFTKRYALGLGYNDASKVSMGQNVADLYYNAGSGLNDGNAHYVVGVGDLAGGNPIIYVDNVSESYTTSLGGANIQANNMGRSPYGYFVGKIDEIRISSIARSFAWIKATYHSNWDNLISFGVEETPTAEGYVLKHVVLTTSYDGVEFVNFPTIPSDFLDLDDTPNSYDGIEDNYLRTTASGITTISGIILQSPNGTEWCICVTNSGTLYTTTV